MRWAVSLGCVKYTDFRSFLAERYSHLKNQRCNSIAEEKLGWDEHEN